MKEYIERAAVETMLENAQIITDGEYCGYCTDDINLGSIPAADVVEVVRCRECSHSQEYLDDELFCLCFEDVVPLYGYCYKGKRKEDEHEQ